NHQVANQSLEKEPKEDPIGLVLFENEEDDTSPPGAPLSSVFTGLPRFTYQPRAGEVMKDEDSHMDSNISFV
ncbi:hypothetical protein PENTCL1PPCAC_12967, partial [Pristionchus entomophagus]